MVHSVLEWVISTITLLHRLKYSFVLTLSLAEIFFLKTRVPAQERILKQHVTAYPISDANVRYDLS